LRLLHRPCRLAHAEFRTDRTQYSFTTNPDFRGAPTGYTVLIREVRLSAGAGFIVAIAGEIVTMPDLPKAPSALVIRFNEAGQIEGLF
jgi:formate--tetrahydrofolate ligase